MKAGSSNLSSICLMRLANLFYYVLLPDSCFITLISCFFITFQSLFYWILLTNPDALKIRETKGK